MIIDIGRHDPDDDADATGQDEEPDDAHQPRSKRLPQDPPGPCLCLLFAIRMPPKNEAQDRDHDDSVDQSVAEQAGSE